MRRVGFCCGWADAAGIRRRRHQLTTLCGGSYGGGVGSAFPTPPSLPPPLARSGFVPVVLGWGVCHHPGKGVPPSSSTTRAEEWGGGGGGAEALPRRRARWPGLAWPPSWCDAPPPLAACPRFSDALPERCRAPVSYRVSVGTTSEADASGLAGADWGGGGVGATDGWLMVVSVTGLCVGGGWGG